MTELKRYSIDARGLPFYDDEGVFVDFVAVDAYTQAASAAAIAQDRSDILARLKQIQSDYLSPQYAVGQPMSSLTERIAVQKCIDSIIAMKGDTP